MFGEGLRVMRKGTGYELNHEAAEPGRRFFRYLTRADIDTFPTILGLVSVGMRIYSNFNSAAEVVPTRKGLTIQLRCSQN
jgi:hypothetical protein